MCPLCKRPAAQSVQALVPCHTEFNMLGLPCSCWTLDGQRWASPDCLVRLQSSARAGLLHCYMGIGPCHSLGPWTQDHPSLLRMNLGQADQASKAAHLYHYHNEVLWRPQSSLWVFSEVCPLYVSGDCRSRVSLNICP